MIILKVDSKEKADLLIDIFKDNFDFKDNCYDFESYINRNNENEFVFFIEDFDACDCDGCCDCDDCFDCNDEISLDKALDHMFNAAAKGGEWFCKDKKLEKELNDLNKTN